MSYDYYNEPVEWGDGDETENHESVSRDLVEEEELWTDWPLDPWPLPITDDSCVLPADIPMEPIA